MVCAVCRLLKNLNCRVMTGCTIICFCSIENTNAAKREKLFILSWFFHNRNNNKLHLLVFGVFPKNIYPKQINTKFSQPNQMIYHTALRNHRITDCWPPNSTFSETNIEQCNFSLKAGLVACGQWKSTTANHYLQQHSSYSPSTNYYCRNGREVYETQQHLFAWSIS